MAARVRRASPSGRAADIWGGVCTNCCRFSRGLKARAASSAPKAREPWIRSRLARASRRRGRVVGSGDAAAAAVAAAVDPESGGSPFSGIQESSASNRCRRKERRAPS
jgi:hypothetical protein